MSFCPIKRVYILLITAVILLNVCACVPVNNKGVSKSSFVLNTVATITLYDSNDESIIDSCFDICRKYESMLSRTIPTSDIARLNSRESQVVSDDTAELLALGKHYSELSDGAFDLTIEPLSVLWNFSSDNHIVPNRQEISAAAEKIDYRSMTIDGNQVSFSSEDTRVDLGAIAKGYIADRMKEYLISCGIEHAIINLGGNVLCIGGKSDSESFNIGIQKPFGDQTIATLSITGQSVVTSGVYERFFEQDGVLYHHILDTKTGMPIDNGLLSVTIVSERSADGDALSTTCFALGLEDGLKLLDSIDGVYGMFITEDYELHFSEGMESSFKIKFD